jgi:hypothetical protein
MADEVRKKVDRPVRKMLTLDRKSARLLEFYAENLNMSQSGLIRFILQQVHSGVLGLALPDPTGLLNSLDEDEDDAGRRDDE